MHIGSVTLSLLLLNASLPSTSAIGSKKKALDVRFLKLHDHQAKRELFANRGGFQRRGKLFSRVAKSRRPEEALNRVLRAITNGKSLKYASKERLSGMLSMIKLNELEDISKIANGCKAIGPFLAFFERSMLAKFSDTRCIRNMAKEALLADAKGAFVANLPVDWIDKRLIQRIASVLHRASPAFLKAVSKATEYSRYMKPKVLGRMNQEQLQQFTPEFVAAIPKLLQSKGIKQAIPKMNDDAFNQYTGRASFENARAMRAPQVRKFNLKNSDSRCYRFPIGYLTDDVFKEGVDGKCVLSYLSNKRVPGIGRKWSLVKEDFVTGASEEALASVRNIKDKDKKFITSATWNAMLKKSTICENIRGEGVFSSEQQIEASGECFSQLRDGHLMAKILLNPKVSEDIFAYASKRTMERIVHKVDHAEYSGFHLLHYMKADSTRKAAILSHISTKNGNGSHACAAIDSVDIIHKNKNEFAAAPVECFAALSFDITDADREKSPCLLATMDLTEAIEAYADKWPSISKSILAALLKRGIASEISKKTFLLINKDALPAFTGIYVKELSYLSEVPKDHLNRLADDAFAYFDADRFSKAGLDYDKVTNNQLPHISTRVTDALKRVMVRLTSTAVKSLGSRFSKFTALQMEAVPAEAWVGVSEKVFSDIAPEALTRVTITQMNKVEEAARLALTAKQADLIGQDVDEKASPLAAFVPLMNKLDKDTQAILKKRLALKAAAIINQGIKKANSAVGLEIPVNFITIAALTALAFLF